MTNPQNNRFVMSEWYWNFMQVPLGGEYNENNMLIVRHPRWEMGMHSFCKTVQIGAVTGMCATLAHYCWYDVIRPKFWPSPADAKRTINTWRINYKAASIFGNRFTRGSIICAPFIYLYYVTYYRPMTLAQLHERSVRVRFNKRSLNSDRAAMVAFFAGWAWLRMRGVTIWMSVFAVLTFLNTRLRDDKSHLLIDTHTVIPDKYYKRLAEDGLPLRNTCDILGGPNFWTGSGSAVKFDKMKNVQMASKELFAQ